MLTLNFNSGLEPVVAGQVGEGDDNLFVGNPRSKISWCKKSKHHFGAYMNRRASLC